jgi:hypothetical protein
VGGVLAVGKACAGVLVGGRLTAGVVGDSTRGAGAVEGIEGLAVHPHDDSTSQTSMGANANTFTDPMLFMWRRRVNAPHVPKAPGVLILLSVHHIMWFNFGE